MDSRVVFHRLVQRDMDGVLRYYMNEASASVADRFFQMFLQIVDEPRCQSSPCLAWCGGRVLGVSSLHLLKWST